MSSRKPLVVIATGMGELPASDSLLVTSVVLQGGTVDGITLGGSVPGPATVTTFTCSGASNHGGPVRLPSYTVATLPAAGTAGRVVFCSNACMFTGKWGQEASGSGTGGLVVDNGSAWCVAGTNVPASA